MKYIPNSGRQKNAEMQYNRNWNLTMTAYGCNSYPKGPGLGLRANLLVVKVLCTSLGKI